MVGMDSWLAFPLAGFRHVADAMRRVIIGLTGASGVAYGIRALEMLAGLAAVAWISRNTGISFLWYNVVGCVVAVLVGLAVSRVGRAD